MVPQPAFRLPSTHETTASCGKLSNSSAACRTPVRKSRNAVIDPLLTFYGDDFTGSTDVLEALHSGGIEAVLFVAPPTDEMLQRYDHVRAFGIAGDSRTMTPDEMDAALPGVFRTLAAYRPKFIHYKVCSTFDSAPEVGSIGRAIDLGQSICNNKVIPLAVASPPLGRYCVFGNLFARSGLNSEPYRLDRHPTMRHHPVTPMTEADLRAHLARQTSRPIELLDVLALDGAYDAACEKLSGIQPPGAVVLFDTITDRHLATVGRLICDLQQQERKPQFVVGSSGVDYALVSYWREYAGAGCSQALRASQETCRIPPVDRMIVLSGSCSPVTNRQIGWALENGYAEVAVDPIQLLNPRRREIEIGQISRHIETMLDRGQSVVVHTSRGPADTRISAWKKARAEIRHELDLGDLLGQILLHVLRERDIDRVAIAGGDTAGQVARSLETEVVEMISPLEPGAPLCRVRSSNTIVDGLEVTFKGGQVGYDDFFGSVLNGQRQPPLIGATP